MWGPRRYLEPLLLEQRKWDLRLYALLTAAEPPEVSAACGQLAEGNTGQHSHVCGGGLQVYLHTEGFTRFSRSDYSLSDLSDSSVHLTNTALSDKGADVLLTTSHAPPH